MSLNLSLLRAHPAEIDADAVIVAIHEDGSLSEAARALDERSGGRISALVASNDASGKPGRCLLTHGLANVRAARVLLVGVGEIAKLDTGRYAKLCLDAMRALKGTPVKRAWSALPELVVNGRDAGWALRQQATAIAQWRALARELGNLPPNICNPAYLAEQRARSPASTPESVRSAGARRRCSSSAWARCWASLGQRQRAAPDRAEVERRRGQRQALRVGRQGHHLRLRRHVAQARSRHGRDEVRHVRRSRRARRVRWKRRGR
jgi:leucyl aminopeptidase